MYPSSQQIVSTDQVNSLSLLATSMIDLTAIALLLGLVAGACVYCLEDLFLRRYLNRVIINRWYRSVKEFRRPAYRNLITDDDAPFQRSWYSLPYKQITGTIAATFQTASIEEFDLRSWFADVGYGLLTFGGQRIEVSLEISAARNDERNKFANSLYYAERALDDLQADLSSFWASARFVLGAFAISVVFFAVSIAGESKAPAFLRLLVGYPVIWGVATLFAPIFRSFIESLASRRV